MGLRNVLGPGRFMISGEELSLARAGAGAGLERGVGNIGFGVLLEDRAVTDLRGLRRITIASGSGAGVKNELISGFTGGREGEGSRDRRRGGDDSSSWSSFNSSVPSSTPGRVTR
jgi:hypothetical protein